MTDETRAPLPEKQAFRTINGVQEPFLAPVSTRQFASDPLMAELPGIGGIDALKKD